MGIIPLWHQEISESLAACGHLFDLIEKDQYQLIRFKDKNVVVNLISTANAYGPDALRCAEVLVSLQREYEAAGIYLVQLWEDLWISRRPQVLGRINSILGVNSRVHGRQTKIISLGQLQADEFLELHHLQGTAKLKYRFGLMKGEELVAVAGFSNLRYMKKGGPVYRSAELIRFATLTGFTVTGGFTKLLKHFIDNYQPNDVMSYADRDWSLGKAYVQAGFTLVDTTPPAEIWLNSATLERYFTHRLPAPSPGSMAPVYLKVFNTGNLKYILYMPSANEDHD